MKSVQKLEAELARVREVLDTVLRLGGQRAWRAELQINGPGTCTLIVTAPAEYEQAALDFIVCALSANLDPNKTPLDQP